jgi:Phytanoyl-CoA dioxygenase (PhyH)
MAALVPLPLEIAMSPAENDPGILANVFGAAGYSAGFAIDSNELAFLRNAIFTQWISHIEAAYPDHAEAFRAGGLEHYHRLSHLISHESLWPKESRVLPREAVSTLTQFDFVQRLNNELGGSARLCDVTFFSETIPGYPEVYWRLVRPGIAKDVGAMHTDKWFHNILGNGKPLFGDDEVTVKMWLAILTEPGLNGLYVVPGSHRRSWRVKYTPAADGYNRPSLDEPLDEQARHLVPVAPGQAILFNENLLHGGALNAGSTSRVSVEITFVLQRAQVPS